MSEQPRYTEADMKASKAIHAKLMSGEITERDLYEFVESGQASPGLVLLISDYTDFGRIRAQDFKNNYQQNMG